MTQQPISSYEQIDSSRLSKAVNECEEWLNKTTIMQKSWAYTFLVVCAIFLIFFNDWMQENDWSYLVFVSLGIYSLYFLVQRASITTGYKQGFEDGFREGHNETLGVDKGLQDFVDKIYVDKEISKEIKK